MTPISDASYNGLGGWALEHPCVWRLSKQDMESCGFIMTRGKEPTEKPHQCSRIRSGHPEHLDRSALPHATANPRRPHHHERPRRQHLCPVMDAPCSQNQTASSTQLSSFFTSFAHPLSFT